MHELRTTNRTCSRMVKKICRNPPSTEFWRLQRYFLNLYHRGLGLLVADVDLWREPQHAWVDGKGRARVRLAVNGQLQELAVKAEDDISNFVGLFCERYMISALSCGTIKNILHAARTRHTIETTDATTSV